MVWSLKVVTRSVSLYLDFIRFTSAFVVFISHAAASYASGGLFWQVGGFSQEAVITFFVLSGFVISYTVDARESSATSYYVNRFARVYSVVLPALLLTFVADIVGSTFHPGLYESLTDYSGDGRSWQFLSGVLFINQIWSNSLRIGTNFPYWSIAFEVWYYVVFGIAVFVPKRWVLPAVMIALAIAGPRISVLFPIWLMGCVGYSLCTRCPLDRRLGSFVWAGSLGLLVVCKWTMCAQGTLYHEFATTPQRLWDYGYYYIVGSLFAANLVGFHGMANDSGCVSDRLGQVVKWLGERTFSLYLFHMPLLFLVAALSPWQPSSVQMRLMVFLGVPALTFALAEVTERRKQAWRKAIQGTWECIGRLRPPSDRTPVQP